MKGPDRKRVYLNRRCSPAEKYRPRPWTSGSVCLVFGHRVDHSSRAPFDFAYNCSARRAYLCAIAIARGPASNPDKRCGVTFAQGVRFTAVPAHCAARHEEEACKCTIFTQPQSPWLLRALQQFRPASHTLQIRKNGREAPRHSKKIRRARHRSPRPPWCFNI